MSIKTESNTYTAIQVKRTNITVDVAKGILLNWLLLKDRGDVEEYIVFTEKDYKNTDSIFDINFDDFFDEIQNSTKKRSDALIMRVKKLFNGDKNKFLEYMTDIKQHYRFENVKKLMMKFIGRIQQFL